MNIHNNTREFNVTQIDPCPLSFCASRVEQAPLFSGETYVNQQIQRLNLKDFIGRWMVFFMQVISHLFDLQN